MTTRDLVIGISLVALATASASAQTNTAEYSQVGTGNVANVDNTVAGNIGNSSTIVQNGNFNTATVYQRQYFNRSYVQQIGTANEAVHQQSGTSNSADTRESGNHLKSAVAQVGASNKAAVDQIGETNISTVRQGYAVDASSPNGEFRPADSNTATVEQTGYGLASEVGQRGANAAAPSADRNIAMVVQRSTNATTTVQQTSRIIQESRGDYAEVFQYDGTPAGVNSSSITQRNSAATATTPDSSNWASLAEEGLGHSAIITQDGSRNSATVRMQGGGAGSAAANQIAINQTGDDLTASYLLRPLTAGRAIGSRAAITQTGGAHAADVYQFGVGDAATISQANGVDVSIYSTGERPRGAVFLSQNTDGDIASIIQTGDNVADVTQAFGAGSSTSVSQTDAGDIAGQRFQNSAIVTQYGSANSTSISQNAIGATATSWQQVGSSNNALTIAQGTGGTGLPSTTGVPGFGVGAQGAGATRLSADVVQAGAQNQASVYQDGADLRAAVSQYGSGSSAYRAIVLVSQTGSANTATAYQASSVAPSIVGDPKSGNSASMNESGTADEFFFGGGARSPEITILQTSSGNSAGVYQYGRGQVARIEQSGSNNIAGILQEIGATNATAVIRQQGTGNSYYIDQVTAGQYVSVTQTGNNNIASNVERGGSGSGGFTPPPGYPGS